MRVSSEFSKYATEYGNYNIIQKKVIDKLLASVKTKPQHILDLGCGSGELCKKIDWDYESFIGVDFAKGMLELHPKSKNITPIYGNFNDTELFEHLKTYKIEHIFSASALQWAEDLESVFYNIKTFQTPISLAIFSVISGMTFSFYFSLPSGATIVLSILVVFIISLVANKR